MAKAIAASGPGSASRWSFPTMISAESARPLRATSSRLSAIGITSSASECRITVSGLTVLAAPHFFQAGQRRMMSRRSNRCSSPRPRPAMTQRPHPADAGRTTPGRSGRPRRSPRRARRVDHHMAVPGQVGRFDAARIRIPTVQEQHRGHRICLGNRKRRRPQVIHTISRSSKFFMKHSRQLCGNE